jgi:hypothetical protein
MLNKGLHVRTFKNYCVTVMDNWTPLRLFWTRDGALKWRDKIGPHAYAYRWHSNIRQWIEMSRGPADMAEQEARTEARS